MSLIFKNGTKSDLNNYRPIYIVPAVAKSFEKILYDQLYHCLNENGLLNSCQSGFLSLHNTRRALWKTNDSWYVNIDIGLLDGVIFIDLKKALDSINHDIILKKTKTLNTALTKMPWNGANLI